MPTHQSLRLEDNRGFEQGREQPIKPDKDQAICSAQPEPRWRRPPQDNKLMPEKCRLGFASRMRSEHSDEHSAEQLQEVDHPEARIAHRGICASPDAIFGSHGVWAKHGLKPQRLDRYMASNNPDFERKAADIIGLYVNPPAHAAVFCVDEKTAIQALDRKDPVLPLSPGRAERHGFEYYRHGTLSLYAAFNTRTGKVLGKTAARHTSAEFVAFLA